MESILLWANKYVKSNLSIVLTGVYIADGNLIALASYCSYMYVQQPISNYFKKTFSY